MKRTLVNALRVTPETSVVLCGWVYRIRALKRVGFIILKDRSGYVQCVVAPELLVNIRLESVIKVTGVVVSSLNDYGPLEVNVEKLEMLNLSEQPLPIIVNQADLDVQLDTLLEHRVLGLRHPKEQAVFKIQAGITEHFASFLRENGFTQIHTPKLVKEGAEGGANVFKLDYFGETAYLAQSPQFYKQMMVISGLERVFEIGPVFRAEAHSTSRHLNEYISLDLEMGFIESETELMALETELMRTLMLSLSENYALELRRLNATLPSVPEEIPHMKLSEAIEILKSQYHKTELEGDLDPEGEKLIAKYVFEKTGSDFLFLTHYPRSKRPMYTKPCGTQETHSFDLLFRGLEITTGGMRIHDLEALKSNMLYKKLDPNAYASYLEAFRYGAPPHGGLAIGLERLTAQLLGFSNIRRTTLFPRDGQRLVP